MAGDGGKGNGKGGGKGGAIKLAAGALAGLPVMLLVVMLRPVIVVVSLLAQAQSARACVEGASSWVAWAQAIAEDDSHGYSQPNRDKGVDYDCASLVWYALKNAGLDVGSVPFGTADMDPVMRKAGFSVIDASDSSQVQAGDVLWRQGHTEIAMGGGRYVGAHQDEDGGVLGRQPGDQTGDEISVRDYPPVFTRIYRLSSGTGQAVSSSTGSSSGSLVGMDEQAARAWFGGRQGPDDACSAYAYGQCTWWSCMRGYRIGWKKIGSFWGNGQDWASSAAAAGFRTTRTAPVAGALMSVPAGVLGSSAAYGHVAVVESVDAGKGTVTTSEKGKDSRVYSRTLPIVNGATYILPDTEITGTGSSSGSSQADAVSSCSIEAVSGQSSAGSSDSDGVRATPARAKAIARRKMKAYGWGDDQWDCLSRMWEKESGWQWNAENPDSGAYGIPQSLPASKMASAGVDWKTNAATQIAWGLDYIRTRYKTPCGAWAMWNTQGWY